MQKLSYSVTIVFMENTNRTISFILGIIVVIIIIAFITGRLNLSKVTFLPLAHNTPTPTESFLPTPTPTPKLVIIGPSIVPTYSPNSNYHNYQTKGGTIPSTGLPTIFLPSMLASFIGGIYLRRKK